MEIDSNTNTVHGDLSLLMSSLRVGQDVNVIKDILAAGAEVNIAGSDGRTPLMMAITSQNNDIIECLIEAGSEVNVVDRYGKTPLMLALSYPNPSECTGKLLKAGALVNVADLQGRTPLMLAVLSKCHQSVDSIIDWGGRVDVTNCNGEIPLILAIQRNLCLDTIKKIILAGADVNVSDTKQRTALMLAIRSRDADLCEVLVTSGAVVGRELHAAILTSLNDVVLTMIQAGAMPRHQHPYNHDMPFVPCSLPNVFRTISVTPLMTALLLENIPLVNNFLSLNFLNTFDLYLCDSLRSTLFAHLESRMIFNSDNDDCLKLARRIYEQPWSLWTLSFVKISTMIGFRSDRRQKLTKTGLPNNLQTKLMFGATVDTSWNK